jgi:divalent metal cation (Fe/Co/Zn/Cd) transporter
MSSFASPESRGADVRSGVRIEVFTVVWMLIEAAVAIVAGINARSVLLTAFGVDSVIELLSGSVLLWRLRVEARGGTLDRVRQTERRAIRISAVLLVLLSLYVVVTSAAGLLTASEPEASLLGLMVAVAALVIMPLLARSKRRLADRLASAALRADAAETVTCAYMAGAVLVGLGLNALFHWWWADYVVALGLLIWLVPETREAIEGALDRQEESEG